MTYIELMQKAGKRISPKIYYFIDNGNTRVEVNSDSTPTIRKYFKSGLVGTVMKGLSVESKVQLPSGIPIYFQNTVRYGSNHATKQFGPYYLKEEPKYDASSRLYSYEYCDNFLTTMVDYTPITIQYPTTVLAFFQQLVLECGFTTNISSLPNGSRVIDHDIYDGIGFTRRDVFDDIAQATGSRFIINGSVVQKASFGTVKITINDDILKNQNIELGEHYGPINCIVLSRSGDSDKIYKRDEQANSWIEFEIKDNQLMNDNHRSEYLDELYAALHGIQYDIMDLELVGYGGFEPFDLVEIKTKKDGVYLTYDSYVLNNEEEFTQGYKEVIYSDLQKGSNTDYKTSDTTDKRINQAYIIVNKQKQEITALTETITGDNGLSQRINTVETKQTSTDFRINAISRNVTYTEYDNDGNPTNSDINSVKTKEKNFTFNDDGFDISTPDSRFKLHQDETGSYYYDGENITGQYTKDGSKQKDLELFGTYSYGKSGINDTPMFVAQLYTDENGEEGFGHFCNIG